MEDDYEKRHDNPHYPYFRAWFSKTLRRTNSCFERDVLRGAYEHLWEEWLKQIKEDGE